MGREDEGDLGTVGDGTKSCTKDRDGAEEPVRMIWMSQKSSGMAEEQMQESKKQHEVILFLSSQNDKHTA